MTGASPPKAPRLVSLDALRGATVAGMVLVNNAGDWSHVHPQLEHAAWNGCTATDLVFPFFVFMVGAALALSPGRDWTGVVRRTVLLFLFGLLLNAFPFVNLGREHYRIPGVLQRIALAYAIAAPLVRTTGPRTWALVGGALLVGYGLAIAPDTSPEGNVGATLDRFLLPGRLYKPAWDPEGLLGTLPTVATALSGALAGRWITRGARTEAMLGVGVVLTVGGLIVGRWLPINKSLWTSSYVLFTSGLALVLLGWFHELVDRQGWQKAAWPLLVFGRNPILAYVASSLVARGLVYGIRVEVAGKAIPAKKVIYDAVFARGGSDELTSFLYAFCYLTAWFAVLAVLDRKKIYLKV